jgi:hypothetical protein
MPIKGFVDICNSYVCTYVGFTTTTKVWDQK